MAPLPTAPNPATWPLRGSEHVFAADLNTQLRSVVQFLSQPPMFVGQQTLTAQSITSTVGPVAANDVVIDSSWIDNYLGLSDVNNIQYTVPAGCGGIWLVTGEVPFNSASSNFGAYVDVNSGTFSNGARVPSGTSTTASPGVVELLNLSPGNTVALNAWQNTGGAVSLLNAVGGNIYRVPAFSAQWVSNTTGTRFTTAPSPRTWVLNDLCTSLATESGAQGSFNVEIRNTLQFLSFPPYCRAADTGAQSGIVTATDTHLTGLSSTGMDNYGAYNATTDTWTCPVSGIYLVAGVVTWVNASAAGYVTEVQATISGTTNLWELYAVQGVTNTGPQGARYIRMTAGDTIQLFGRQNSGGNLATLGSASTKLITLWTGA